MTSSSSRYRYKYTRLMLPTRKKHPLVTVTCGLLFSWLILQIQMPPSRAFFTSPTSSSFSKSKSKSKRAFPIPSSWISSSSRHHVAPPTRSTTPPDTDNSPPSSPSSSPLPPPSLDWNASANANANANTSAAASGVRSIGSLLWQLQKKEQELKSKMLLDDDEATLLDNNNKNNNNNQTLSSSSSSQAVLPSPPQPPLDPINYEMAKELDQCITTLPQLGKPLTDGMILLDMPDLYQVLLGSSKIQQETLKLELELPSLSRPDHYQDRIGRDMRHLAVSIASSVQTVEQWRLFYALYGGIFPLIECLQEGAQHVRDVNGQPNNDSLSARSSFGQQRRQQRQRQQQQRQRPPAEPSLSMDVSESTMGTSPQEESFLAASSALCALRDLCALAPELAAVVTDGLLRAHTGTLRDNHNHHNHHNNQQSKEASTSLLDDFCTLLQYAHDHTEYDYQHLHLHPPDRRRGLNNLNLNMFRRQKAAKWTINGRRNRKEARWRCQLYVTQLLLAMTVASDSAVDALRSTPGLKQAVLKGSSYAPREKTRRWLRYSGKLLKLFWRQRTQHQKTAANEDSSTSSTATSTTVQSEEPTHRPFIQATELSDDLKGRIRGTSNQVLAAMGYNQWVPKMPGQKGLRILCLDGGGSRGISSVTSLNSLVESVGGLQISDSFDMVVGTSTGAIIAFLVGLRRETSAQAVERYNDLVAKIFTKTAMSTPLLLFTTAAYEEAPFMDILSDILGDETMLDSRADPSVPYVFAVTSKMSSTPTHISLFRNYNYQGGELPDPFTLDPGQARASLGLSLDMEHPTIRAHSYPNRASRKNNSPGVKSETGGSRHPGSFRVLQRYALRASTAAPTVFKPVMMGGEMYCDGGIVASNPTAIAIHEARNLFPDIPIELVVSIGTGGFLEQKSAPRIGWDGIINQIIGSATDGEQIHHLLEDILGEDGTAGLGKSSVSNTRYLRLNPVVGFPDAFPIDVTDPEKLQQLKTITLEYMQEPEQQRKVEGVADILKGRPLLRKWLRKR